MISARAFKAPGSNTGYIRISQSHNMQILKAIRLLSRLNGMYKFGAVTAHAKSPFFLTANRLGNRPLRCYRRSKVNPSEVQEWTHMEPEKSKAKTLKKRAFKVKRKNTGWVRKPVVTNTGSQYRATTQGCPYKTYEIQPWNLSSPFNPAEGLWLFTGWGVFCDDMHKG